MNNSELKLDSGSKVAVIGGGPAGSLFTFFLLEMAGRAGVELHPDIYEFKDYTVSGAAGCNMCGGIISESLVQLLATEGINLPCTVVQRSIDSYRLHMDVGSVTIATPVNEGRIAAVHRGGGPRGNAVRRWDSFDGHLLGLAVQKGATVMRQRVEDVAWVDGRPCIVGGGRTSDPYDLLVVATGVNSGARKLLEKLGHGYTLPATTKTAISEFRLGTELMQKYFGNSMHVFLLNLPRLEFAALIPKGEFVTAVLLGKDVDNELVSSFMNAPEVRACFPPEWTAPADHCRCFPSINFKGSAHPFADRMVFIGDCGESRLYKDGIGGAYRTAKAAAKTALFEGVSAEAFRTHFLPTCRSLRKDNAIGKLVFSVTGIMQRLRFSRRGILRMVEMEQKLVKRRKRMSGVLWDLFTGSAPYRSVLMRTLHPYFNIRLVLAILDSLAMRVRAPQETQAASSNAALGRVYRAGETIIRQGESGDSMFVIQSGSVEILREGDGHEVFIVQLDEGEFFGEMAMFQDNVRTTTARAVTDTRLLTVDRQLLVQKVHEDPSLAFRMINRMAARITELSEGALYLSRARVDDAVRTFNAAAK